jgi:hypothetical protein
MKAKEGLPVNFPEMTSEFSVTSLCIQPNDMHVKPNCSFYLASPVHPCYNTEGMTVARKQRVGIPTLCCFMPQS